MIGVPGTAQRLFGALRDAGISSDLIPPPSVAMQQTELS